jgi:amidohydrolase
MSPLKIKIQELSNLLLPTWVEIRRHLHANPELSFKEYQTSKFIQETLAAEGIEYKAGWVNTGITAFVYGKNPDSRKFSLRGDIDALPIQELNNIEYSSKNDGVMHACGHDAHTTCALGAAIILHRLREFWEGTIQIIFQPGEEYLPGGANEMIKEGVFNEFVPTGIIGQHVDPEIPIGKVGFKPGWYMASSDEVRIKVIGKGGHGAKPEKCIDPILISAHLITALQQVASRWTNANDISVLTIGKIQGLGATNIIPDFVALEGTFRTFNEVWRYQAHEKIIQLSCQLCESMGGKAEVDIRVGYPALFNDEKLTEKSIEIAKDYLGPENVLELTPRTTAEDFAYFAQQFPGCFYRLGTSSPDGSNSAPLHNSYFNLDEAALAIGPGLLAYLATQA